MRLHAGAVRVTSPHSSVALLRVPITTALNDLAVTKPADLAKPQPNSYPVEAFQGYDEPLGAIQRSDSQLLHR